MNEPTPKKSDREYLILGEERDDTTLELSKKKEEIHEADIAVFYKIFNLEKDEELLAVFPCSYQAKKQKSTFLGKIFVSRKNLYFHSSKFSIIICLKNVSKVDKKKWPVGCFRVKCHGKERNKTLSYQFVQFKAGERDAVYQLVNSLVRNEPLEDDGDSSDGDSDDTKDVGGSKKDPVDSEEEEIEVVPPPPPPPQTGQNGMKSLNKKKVSGKKRKPLPVPPQKKKTKKGIFEESRFSTADQIPQTNLHFGESDSKFNPKTMYSFSLSMSMEDFLTHFVDNEKYLREYHERRKDRNCRIGVWEKRTDPCLYYSLKESLEMCEKLPFYQKSHFPLRHDSRLFIFQGRKELLWQCSFRPSGFYGADSIVTQANISVVERRARKLDVSVRAAPVFVKKINFMLKWKFNNLSLSIVEECFGVYCKLMKRCERTLSKGLGGGGMKKEYVLKVGDDDDDEDDEDEDHEDEEDDVDDLKKIKEEGKEDERSSDTDDDSEFANKSKDGEKMFDVAIEVVKSVTNVKNLNIVHVLLFCFVFVLFLIYLQHRSQARSIKKVEVEIREMIEERTYFSGQVGLLLKNMTISVEKMKFEIGKQQVELQQKWLDFRKYIMKLEENWILFEDRYIQFEKRHITGKTEIKIQKKDECTQKASSDNPKG